MRTVTPLVALHLAALLSAQDAAPPEWPSFRGPFARGVADGAPTPAEWDVASGRNVAWKCALPGLAHSSPIVAGERIFVTNAIRDVEDAPEDELKVGLYGDVGSVEDDSPYRFELTCIDRATGAIRWTRVAWRGVPKFKRHPKGSFAASTPATDGRVVVASFGTEGLHAFDLDGEHLWTKDLGPLDAGWYVQKDAEWGFGSSPVLHDGRVYVQCDVQDRGFVACFDAADGEELWRTARDDVPTWSTPTVDVGGERAQLVVNGYRHIGGYDLATGEALWWLRGGGDIPVPTPVVDGDTVVITNAHGRMAPILAIARDAAGELSIGEPAPEAVRWAERRGGNYMQTPLVYGGLLYCCRDNGVLSCFDLATGTAKYQTRLGSGYTGFTASGVAADGKLYFTSEMGETYVVAAGPEFELLATNELGETCMASPAVAGGTLYFRARHHLIAVAATDGG